MKKSLRDFAREINEEAITKKEQRALKKAKGSTILMKVFPMDLEILLNRGWEVLSHTQSTYASNQSYVLMIETEKLRERLSHDAAV